MIAPAEILPLKRYCSVEDWILLDAIDSTSVCTGRFLTMQKRRRKKLATRSLSQYKAILDDVLHGQVKWILDHCYTWSFNAFALETAAGGRSLTVLCVHLFHWYGLLDHFQIDVVRIWKLFTLIEEGYHSTNPYHNSIHAADVTQAMHCFLQEEKIRKHVTPLEVMASLIGAVAHDLDHPGVNQHFLISTSNHLAILYQNSSVLENHHWRSAVGCLLESGVAQQLVPHRAELETQIRELILATDINRQQEFLTKFKAHLDDGTLDVSDRNNRHFVLQIALKCADISNPTRPWDVSHKWSLKVCDEFFRQGEFERQLNLPITSICDQQSTSVAKIQAGFFRFIVTPLYSEWHRFLSSSLSTLMMRLLESNRKRWEAQDAMEQAEETHTELSEAEIEPEISEDELTKESSDAMMSVSDLIEPPKRQIRRQSLAVPTLESILGVRRYSMPVNRRDSVQTPRTSPARSLRGDRKLMNNSDTSVVSSGSPDYMSAEDNTACPLSAEYLIPEPSIASMTSSSSMATSRLTSVLQGGRIGPSTKFLTRQQTFPPPQPCVRMRYMSATIEMMTCKEIVLEEPTESTSDGSTCATAGRKRKLEPPDERLYTTVKLSDSAQCHEKENLDPRRLIPTISLTRRRGSAPVPSPPVTSFGGGGGGLRVVENGHFTRRSSVPAEVTWSLFKRDNHVEQTSASAFQRRGSAPTDLPPQFGERVGELTRHMSLNERAAGRRKKQLYRRSSGGPEIICTEADVRTSFTRLSFRRSENPDTLLLAQRRGSLPIDVLTVGHSVF